MKMTGQILKEHREKQGITVKEIASAIKVNTKIVTAIENGDLDNLPAKTFLRGFVQSYASILKLDVDSVLHAFYEEMGSTKPKTAIRDHKTQEQERRASATEAIEKEGPSIFMSLGWGTGLVILALLILFLVKQVEKYENESKTTPHPNLESIDSPATVATEKPLVVTPKNIPKPKPTPKPQKPIEPKVSSTQKPTVEPPSPKPTAQAEKPQANAPAKPTPAATPESSPPTTPIKKPEVKTVEPPIATANEKKEDKKPKKEEKKTAKTRQQEVIIEAFDNIDISFSIDGKNRRELKLKEDQIKILKASKNILLTISDGGSVNIIHNGKDKGVPGSLGSAVNLTFPKK